MLFSPAPSQKESKLNRKFTSVFYGEQKSRKGKELRYRGGHYEDETTPVSNNEKRHMNRT